MTNDNLEIGVPGRQVGAKEPGSDDGGPHGDTRRPPPREDTCDLWANSVLADILAELPSDGTGNTARERFSPLVFCGPRGSGKARLAHLLVKRFCATHGRNSARATTAPLFARQRTAARSGQSLRAFRVRWRGLRLWALNHLDRLPNSRIVQREMVATLDALEESSASVVVTVPYPVLSMDHLTPALRDRLQGGLTVPINPRTLPQLVGLDATPASKQAQEGTSETTVPPPREIVAIVAKYFAIPLQQVRSASRQTSTVRARAIAMYLVRHLTRQSYSQIGPLLGGRDHTTVLHHCQKIERLVLSDPATRQLVEDLRRIILSST